MSCVSIGHSKAVRDVCFNNTGTQFLSAAYDRYLKLWDSETGESLIQTHQQDPRWMFRDEFSISILNGLVYTSVESQSLLHQQGEPQTHGQFNILWGV